VNKMGWRFTENELLGIKEKREETRMKKRTIKAEDLRVRQGKDGIFYVYEKGYFLSWCFLFRLTLPKANYRLSSLKVKTKSEKNKEHRDMVVGLEIEEE